MQYLTKGEVDTKMPKHRKRTLEIDARDYTMIGQQLYKRGKDGNLRLCVCENEYIPILQHAHSGIAAGHFLGDTTARNILWYGLWWPTLFHDAKEFVKTL